MGQSLVQNYIHIVFSTKYRKPMIKRIYEQELYAYIGGICNELECQSIIVGGYTDHIHILCRLSKKMALMTLVQKVKASSSKWMKTRDKSLENFFWQNGYGAFSVNPRQVDVVKRYIENQYEHHAKKSFQQEYRDFLENYKLEYNEDFVWD